jgi:hypothetical protein
MPPVYTEVAFQTAIPVQEPPPLELDDELLLELEELDEDELLDELDELLLDEELELLLEDDPVVSHAPKSLQALVQAQPTPGS